MADGETTRPPAGKPRSPGRRRAWLLAIDVAVVVGVLALTWVWLRAGRSTPGSTSGVVADRPLEPASDGEPSAQHVDAANVVLEGTVVSDDGPVADAEVAAVVAARGERDPGRTAVTDSSGHFRVEAGPGAVALSAWTSRAWAYLELPVQVAGHDVSGVLLRLVPGRTVSGRCVDRKGRAVGHVAVCVHGVKTHFRGGCVDSEPTGRFVIGGVPTGQQVALLSPDERRPVLEGRLLVAPGTASVVFVVERAK